MYIYLSYKKKKAARLEKDFMLACREAGKAVFEVVRPGVSSLCSTPLPWGARRPVNKGQGRSLGAWVLLQRLLCPSPAPKTLTEEGAVHGFETKVLE